MTTLQPQSTCATSPERVLESLLLDITSAARRACLIHRYRASENEIDDLCQEVILMLMEDDYRRLRSFDYRKAPLRIWLKAVVAHHVSNYLQRQKRLTSIEDIAPDSIYCKAVQEDDLISEDHRRMLQYAVEKLSERERQLLDHIYSERMTPTEAARAMGIKVDSFYRRKHALIKKLQKLMELPASRSAA